MPLKNGEITLPTKFLESQKIYEDGKIIIVGVPMDSTCSFRPGTRFGPQKN
jgi:agmatinase